MLSGWKTVTFGLILALLSVFSNAEMTAWFAENLPAVGGSVGVIVVLLRAITNSDIFKSNP